jgi:nicotinic acid mononucleotide adenylyltransferase/tRNA A-37 threonylcarbamoyl transferase component Bud32
MFDKLKVYSFLALWRGRVLALCLAVLGPGLPVFQASGKVLEAADLIRIRKVAIFVGTFDPPTLGHQEAVLKTLESGAVEAVIVLPNGRVAHKTPLPLAHRLDLWNKMSEGDARILVPSQGVFKTIQENRSYSSPEFMNHLLAINPALEIQVMAGSDVIQKTASQLLMEMAFRPKGWIHIARPNMMSLAIENIHGKPVTTVVQEADVSSTQVRRLLHANRDLYFANEADQVRACESFSLAILVCLEIFRRGLYVGKDDRTLQGFGGFLKRKVKGFFYGALNRFGLYEEFKDLFVRWAVKQASLSELLENDSHVPELKMLKILGQGMSSTAYLVEINGSRLVLKIPHLSDAARMSLKRAVETSLWLNKKTAVAGAKVVDFDENGHWALYEFVEGEDLKRIISKSTPGKPILSAARYRSLQTLFNQVLEIKRTSAIFLDFAPDNIVFRGETAHLIDHGQTAMEQPLVSLQAELVRWVQIYHPEKTAELKATEDCEKAVSNL